MNPPKTSDASRSEATSHPIYAVVRHGGHQYRVTPGDRLLVNRLTSEVGAVVGLEPVLLLSGADGVQVDGPSLEGVRVAATVTAHRRGKKLRVFTFKPKKRHRRTLGFRADLTELVVDRVLAKGEALPEPITAEEPEAEEIEAAAPEVEAFPEPEEEPAATTPRRRRGARAAAEEIEASDAAVEPAPEAAVETPVRRRARRPATAEPEAEAAPEVEPAAPSGTAASTGAAAPARRARTAAAGPEAPESAAPPPARRRIERTSPPPEAAE